MLLGYATQVFCLVDYNVIGSIIFGTVLVYCICVSNRCVDKLFSAWSQITRRSVTVYNTMFQELSLNIYVAI